MCAVWLKVYSATEARREAVPSAMVYQAGKTQVAQRMLRMLIMLSLGFVGPAQLLWSCLVTSRVLEACSLRFRAYA